MKTVYLFLFIFLSPVLGAAQDVAVDTTTYKYALARIGLSCSGASGYELVKASFSGKLSAEGRVGALYAKIEAQERLDDQAATDAISEKYGRLRLLASGEGIGDIPDELMPTPMPDDAGRMLYVAPAGASGQYGITNRAQAVYKALIGPLYCADTDILYFITLLYPFDAFSYGTAAAELNHYSCSVRIPPAQEELETVAGKPSAGRGKNDSSRQKAGRVQPQKESAATQTQESAPGDAAPGQSSSGTYSSSGRADGGGESDAPAAQPKVKTKKTKHAKNSRPG
ncbi:MAG TPA: hypothetical protein PLL10_00555 [Elusimicrobiales bacterium]|nr:hypothetical protein [Elusimicrobiales bacterium]